MDGVSHRMTGEVSSRYRGYVLLVLMLVYMFNFLDRQILSILAEDIKHDLGISDAAMGFLLGTSFAVFYAVFGIPLGKAADLVNRTRLISAGLLLWSLMTSLSGAASGFAPLATCRMLVGVGEASASPAVYSLLYDYFPKRLRTTAIAIYSSGIFVGAGLGLIIGGFILVAWKHHFPTPASAPLGLRAWQAAFIVVGLPGVLLAAWIASLREPMRGAADGAPVAPHKAPLKPILEELGTLLPGTGLLIVSRLGGPVAACANLAILGCVAQTSWLLIHMLGGTLQWVTLGYGAYAFGTWCQKLSLADRPSFRAIFGCRTLVLGLSYAVMGFLGVTAGGIITDRMVARHGGRGRLLVAAAAVSLATLSMAALLFVGDKTLAYALTIPFNFFSAMYVAPGAANVNSLAPPRIRATASAAYIVCQVLLGTALGPYIIGVISDTLIAHGAGPGEAIRSAMLLSLVASAPAIMLLLLAARSAPQDEARIE